MGEGLICIIHNVSPLGHNVSPTTLGGGGGGAHLHNPQCVSLYLGGGAHLHNPQCVRFFIIYYLLEGVTHCG